MSTVKISQLPEATLNANTSNTIFVVVDIESETTGKVTGYDVATNLYKNNVLNVGQNPVILSGVAGQFSGDESTFLQINVQNINQSGSEDYVATADIGTDANNYIDLGINNSNYSDSAYSAMKPLDGYLYTHGSLNSSYNGNLIIGTASSSANIVLIAGGTTSSNIVGRISKTKFDFLKDVNVTGNITTTGHYTFSDASTQSTAASPIAYTQSSFDKANTGVNNAASASLYANTGINNAASASSYANTGINNAASASLYANTGINNAASASSYANTGINNAASASLYANNANTWIQSHYLANTTGALFNGTLNVGNKLNVNGSVIFANTNFTSTESAFTIAACPQNQVQTPSNDGYMLHISGKQDVPSRIVFDSFGVGTYGLLAGRTSRGTPTAPTATQNGDILLRMSGNGWGTTGYAPLGIAKIDIVATENYTDAARGSQIQFWNITNGSNTLTQIAAFNGDSAHFTGNVYPEKGLVYNTRTFSAAQTAITLTFTTDSLVRATLTADLTLTLNSFLAGKIVDVWLTNTGGAQRTITHGCSALNSSVNATTFNIPGTSSAYLKYFSLDGNLANTFVTISHA